jgi:subtilisin family serine protease
VAPGAHLYSVKVLDHSNGGDLSNILCGVDWVTAHAGQVRVANLSLGAPGSDDGACGMRNHDALHIAICRSVRKGVTYVVAAGNSSIDVRRVIPAAYGEVITVSGLADSDGRRGGRGSDCGDGYRDDVFAPFSNHGRDVDIAAVATCVVTDYRDGSLVIDDGTSFAAPAASGAAALLLARYPRLGPRAVRDMVNLTRERGHLPGDPDQMDEGVLDVSRF